jgi:hypothetical protein
LDIGNEDPQIGWQDSATNRLLSTLSSDLGVHLVWIVIDSEVTMGRPNEKG